MVQSFSFAALFTQYILSFFFTFRRFHLLLIPIFIWRIFYLYVFLKTSLFPPYFSSISHYQEYQEEVSFNCYFGTFSWTYFPSSETTNCYKLSIFFFLWDLQESQQMDTIPSNSSSNSTSLLDICYLEI